MSDNLDIKDVAIKVLSCVEMVTKFATSINPIFGIVSSVVGTARQILEETTDHDPALDKGFKEINTMLKEFSEKNNQLKKQICVNEVNENLKKYEEYISRQYSAFIDMIKKVEADKTNTKKYMADYGELYKTVHGEEALQVYYNNVAKNDQLFGRPVLEVYLDACDYNHEKMEQLCLYLAQIFQKGIIALVAFTAATDDDVQQMKEKWEPRVTEIQEKFEEVLKKCEKSS